jgi:hypothetical protein
MLRQPTGKLVANIVSITALGAFLVLAATVIPVAHGRTLTSRQQVENCPKDPPLQLMRNPWSRAQLELAPHGARVINLCRYASGRTRLHSLKLAGNDLVTKQATKRQLISEFDALKGYHGPPLRCPKDTGDEVLATLVYRRHEVAILVNLRGCPFAANGDIRRAAFPFDGDNQAGPRLLSQLKRLTHKLRSDGDIHLAERP